MYWLVGREGGASGQVEHQGAFVVAVAWLAVGWLEATISAAFSDARDDEDAEWLDSDHWGWRLWAQTNDVTYRRARMRAASEGTSLSAIVRDFLDQLASAEDERENRRMAALEEL